MSQGLIGHFAVSLAGKDKGRIVVITGVTDDNRLLVSDGRHRKVAKPKIKQRKHLKILESAPLSPEKASDRLLRQAIREREPSRDLHDLKGRDSSAER